MKPHKYTFAIIRLINEFLNANELTKTTKINHCADTTVLKKKNDQCYLQILKEDENPDFYLWEYKFYFSIVNERVAKSQELLCKLSEVLTAFGQSNLKIRVKKNLPDMTLNIKIIEKRVYES